MVTFYASDLFDFSFCNRLFICNNRQCLQHDVSKCGLFGVHCKTYQTLIVFFFAAHLVRLLKFYDLNATILLLVTVHHILQDFPCCFFVLLDRVCNLCKFNGISHGK